MISKDLDSVDENDLQNLVDENIPEGKKIEYKETLPNISYEDKIEFLCDVSSFANTSGGYLIFGISEDHDKGLPEELKGLNVSNPDQEINRLENIIKQGLEPRIPTIHIKTVKLTNSTYDYALVIKIEKSFIGPHRVTFRGHDKFYSRTSAGKFPMDSSELRTAFVNAETHSEKIRDFRNDRITMILAGEAPIPMNKGPKLIIHLIPLNSFDNETNYDLSNIESKKELINNLSPCFDGWNHHHNFDGFLTYCGGLKEESRAYIQLFKNGIIESFMNFYESESRNINGLYNEKAIINSISRYLKVLRHLGVEPPIYVFITFIGIKDFTMPTGSIRSAIGNDVKIDKDDLDLDGVILENYNDKMENILKPAFDAVWNAFGYGKSGNYNENGEWEPQ